MICGWIFADFWVCGDCFVWVCFIYLRFAVIYCVNSVDFFVSWLCIDC